MAIPITLFEYLNGQGIDYELLAHPKTECSAQTAEVSNIPENCLAKGVLVKRKSGYLLAIVPASRRVALSDLGSWLKQPVCLATEEEVAEVFCDCKTGAVPAVGAPYGIKAVVDERLANRRHVYFEGGDHRTLVHVDHDEFEKLMAKVPKHRFSKPVYELPMSEGTDASGYSSRYWGGI